MTSSRVLPWIGAPSRMSPGLARNLTTLVDGDRHDEHEDRHRADQQDVVERVDLVRRAAGAAVGNQWIESAIAMPITEATAPMVSICASGCLRTALTSRSHGARVYPASPTSGVGRGRPSVYACADRHEHEEALDAGSGWHDRRGPHRGARPHPARGGLRDGRPRRRRSDRASTPSSPGRGSSPSATCSRPSAAARTPTSSASPTTCRRSSPSPRRAGRSSAPPRRWCAAASATSSWSTAATWWASSRCATSSAAGCRTTRRASCRGTQRRRKLDPRRVPRPRPSP